MYLSNKWLEREKVWLPKANQSSEQEKIWWHINIHDKKCDDIQQSKLCGFVVEKFNKISFELFCEGIKNIFKNKKSSVWQIYK
jgi:hypothetical protein